VNGEQWKRGKGLGVVGWRGIADFSQFEGGPGASACEGDLGINDGEFAGFGNPDHVFVM
jgi:hypothetical protein